MNWIVIEGVKPYDGRYEFDLAGRELTTREWGFVKRLSGYMPLTLEEGFEGGDPELFAAFAAIALSRAGKIDARQVDDVFDRIADAPFGTTIRLESDRDVEQDEAKPDPTIESPNGNTGTSGAGSPTSSERSDDTRTRIGMPASGSSEWPLTTSAT